jgi:hypothetical protein
MCGDYSPRTSIHDACPSGGPSSQLPGGMISPAPIWLREYAKETYSPSVTSKVMYSGEGQLTCPWVYRRSWQGLAGRRTWHTMRPRTAELRRREGRTLGHRWGWRSSVPSPIAATSTARTGGWLGASRWASLVKADQCADHFINHWENQDLHPVCPRTYDAASAASRACGCARGMRGAQRRGGRSSRELDAVNRLLEPGNPRDPALKGRVFAIRQRRLPPSVSRRSTMTDTGSDDAGRL